MCTRIPELGNTTMIMQIFAIARQVLSKIIIVYDALVVKDQRTSSPEVFCIFVLMCKIDRYVLMKIEGA